VPPSASECLRVPMMILSRPLMTSDDLPHRVLLDGLMASDDL